MSTFTWETREQWGALPPKGSLSTNIAPVDGCKIHYGGAGPFKRTNHSDCRAIFRAWQRMHQADTVNNYVDLAYNLGACHHGVLMEARSTQKRPKIRSGANGNSYLNGRAFAVVAIWGSLDGEPPQSLIDTLAGGVAFMRAEAGAARGVYGHRDGWSTSCPGDAIYRRLPDIRRIADEGPDDMPTLDEIKDAVRDVVREEVAKVGADVWKQDLEGQPARWWVKTTKRRVLDLAGVDEDDDAPEPCDGYRVVKGDSLSRIAIDNGVTLTELLEANPDIIDPNRIEVGDCITIPKG